MKPKIRWQFVGSLFLIAGLVLGACAQPGAPTAPTGDQAAAPAAEQPAAQAVEVPEGAAADQVLQMAVDSGPGNGPVPGLDYGVAGLPGATYWTIMRAD